MPKLDVDVDQLISQSRPKRARKAVQFEDFSDGEEYQEMGIPSEDESEEYIPKSKATKPKITKSAPRTPASRTNFRNHLLNVISVVPRFQEVFVETDQLRCAAIVARDIARLAHALCADSQQMEGLWKEYASQHDDDDGSSDGNRTVLDAAKARYSSDDAHTDLIHQFIAKRVYRLNDAELALLPHENVARRYRRGVDKMHKLIVVREASFFKHGSYEKLQAEIAKNDERSEKAARTRAINQEIQNAQYYRKVEVRDKLINVYKIPRQWVAEDDLKECSSFIVDNNKSGLKKTIREAAKRLKKSVPLVQKEYEKRVQAEGVPSSFLQKLPVELNQSIYNNYSFLSIQSKRKREAEYVVNRVKMEWVKKMKERRGWHLRIIITDADLLEPDFWEDFEYLIEHNNDVEGMCGNEEEFKEIVLASYETYMERRQALMDEIVRLEERIMTIKSDACRLYIKTGEDEVEDVVKRARDV